MADERQMTFLEHLDEFRTRIIRSLLAIVLCTSVAFYFNEHVVTVLKLPLTIQINDVIAGSLDLLYQEDGSVPSFLTLVLRTRSSVVQAELFKEGPLEGILAFLGISLAFGCVLASPVVLYQVWAFVLPALKDSEKRFALPLFFSILIFFTAGCLFAYFVVAPVVLQFSAGLFPGLQNQWMVGRHVSFIIRLLLGFGIGFELPIVMGFLARIGVMDANAFRDRRRYAVVLIFIASALLTPADLLSMLLMAFPLMGLYELGIGVATFVVRKEQTNAESV